MFSAINELQHIKRQVSTCYQVSKKKQQQTFATETTYFIYIILALTTIIFICLLPTISINQFKNLLSVSILLPNSIILEGQSALGKNFHVEGVMVGISQFQQFNHQDFTHSQFNITQFKQSSYSFDNNLIYAMATCHTLEFVQDKIQGSNIQRQIFEFSKAKIIKKNEFYCMNQQIIVLRKILYKDKKKKLAVVVSFKTEQLEQKKNELVSFIDEEQKSIQFLKEKETQIEKKLQMRNQQKIRSHG